MDELDVGHPGETRSATGSLKTQLRKVVPVYYLTIISIHHSLGALPPKKIQLIDIAGVKYISNDVAAGVAQLLCYFSSSSVSHLISWA